MSLMERYVWCIYMLFISSHIDNIQVVYQLPATTQWIFECHWCPRNPDIICTASFDGHVSLYSLLGGGRTPDDMVPKSPIKVSHVHYTSEMYSYW